MTLEKLLKPVHALDRFLHRQFYSIGEEIPQSKRYLVTTGCMVAGVLGEFQILRMYLPDIAAGIIFQSSAAFSGLPDIILNAEGRDGNLDRHDTQDVKTLDASVENMQNINRKMRLGVFTIGAAYAGSCVYDIAQSTVNGHALPESFSKKVQAGLGFMLWAAGMYIKDRNPKRPAKDPLYKRVWKYMTQRPPALAPEVIRIQPALWE
ncbi:hypothetical protein J4464_06210 [Candidatus Woesearchaeota archaeon]|nr:hypothetical protein [Candidatus Woesearchaeota archaeon]